MGQPKIMLYSLVIKPPDPLFKHYHPAIRPHTRNARLLSDPSDHAARGVPNQDSLVRTPLWPPSNGHFTPLPEPSDYPANEGWRWQEDIKAWANCHHVLSPLGFKCQKQNQPNPLKQDSPIPTLPREQTPQQLTPGPSGTQLLEDLFRSKKPKFYLISTFDSSELTLPPFVEPS
ncbi:hypothetical protein O181_031761 [Austropuccinia psidii MF-1]|uniref:Uncharacterized protein n=1 Tax=Austropuccinia psidii MF-1 TaxID=1389203 RepID=A0A9Q3CVH8_9BASI|nr:hypothetical protein [Austropuccinia psidii MF-1]